MVGSQSLRHSVPATELGKDPRISGIVKYIYLKRCLLMKKLHKPQEWVKFAVLVKRLL